MKTKHSLLLLVALAIQLLFVTGCGNTAHGVSQDYHRAEDKIEGMGK